MNFLIRTLCIASFLSLSACSFFRPSELPPTAAASKEYKQGVVYRDYWLNVSGASVDDLKASPNFPDKPDGFDALTTLAGPTNWGEDYGDRVEALISPPQTGNYRFYLSGNDITELYLSTDQNPSGKKLIAKVPGYTNVGQWTKYTAQLSPDISLEKGKLYYLEVLHKEGYGSDHFAVAWEGPGVTFQVVQGSALFPFISSSGPSINEDFKKGYSSGYRMGFFDGEHGYTYYPTYPPVDADNDGLPDNWETFYGLNPADPNDAQSDKDDDGLSAYDEYILMSSPSNPDSDKDGIPDGFEVLYGLNPLDPSDAELDLDGDGYTNLEEFNKNTDPSDSSSTPPSAITNGLKVAYWNNVTGTSVDKLTSLSTFPNSPSETGTLDNFQIKGSRGDAYGARIWGYLVPKTTGKYTFWISSDDTSQLLLSTDSLEVNKREIAKVSGYTSASQWNKYTSQQSVDISLEAGKVYYIEALFKEDKYGDHVEVAWQGPGITQSIITKEYLQTSVSTAPTPSDYVEGFTGQYFNTADFRQFEKTQVDSQINFNWGSAAPFTGMNNDSFSVRWTGKVKATHKTGAADYTFTVAVNDGARLWVDNKLLIDQWKGQSLTTYSATTSLEAGKTYNIKLEYYEGQGSAQIALSWIPPGSTTATVIPATAVQSLDSSKASTVDDDKDGMPDYWELQHGLDTSTNDSTLVLNSKGISALQAYQQKLNPWTGAAAGSIEVNPTDLTLQWDAPSQRQDGTPMYPSEVETYVLQYGTSISDINQSIQLPGTTTSYTLKSFSSGTYYFQIYVLDVDGLKSAPSAVVTLKVP